jgi:hypothetical protein
MRAKRGLTLRTLGVVLLVFVVDVVCAWAQAEGVVRGEVLADADRSAIGQATVTLSPVTPGETLRSTTDVAGRFAFANVRTGEYVLSASAEGFAPRELRLVIAPRELRSLTLALEVRGLAVSVDVVAERPLPSTHSPSSTLLTPERLNQMPVAQRTNVADAIVTAAPGMIRGHDDFVHIRGHEVALNPTINGVQFWENAHAMFSPGLGVDYIDSINVMTGGFSAEYGNRFGGILDVVTKSGFTMRNRGSVTFGSGTAQRHNIGIEYGL